MLDLWNIASITFLLDEAIRDVFPLTKSVKRGMKAVKCGIRLWTKCDAKTGYVYATKIMLKEEIIA